MTGEGRRALLLELAAQCERVPGPNFALEQAIGQILGIRHLPEKPVAPAFTASLDAAVRLVPDGWYWRAGHGALWKGWSHLNRVHPDHCDREDEHNGHAETPALALCASALRAHASPREMKNALRPTIADSDGDDGA